MKSIAVVILNWKQPQLTCDTINSLLNAKEKGFKFQIILVDNASPDNSLSKFKKKYSQNSKITIIANKSNLGYAGGNNSGIKHALKKKFDLIVLLNNDVLVKDDFLINLTKESSKFDILTPKIYFAPGFEYYKNRYQPKEKGKVIWAVGGQIDWNNIYCSNIGIDQVDNGQFNQINDQIDFASGCCLMVKRKVFQKIGLLNEKYFMYLEDVDFCQQAKRNNFKIAYVPKSVIWHINSGSTSGPGNLQNYFLTRNRIYFARKFAPIRTNFAILRESFKLFFSKDKWRRLAIKDAYLNRMERGSWK